MLSSKYSISNTDLEKKCWWCGTPVTGFDKSRGRDRKPFRDHYCNKKCYHNAQDILASIEKEQECKTTSSEIVSL